MDTIYSIIFKIFADSAYADDVSRKSTFGNVTFLNGGPISWQSTLAKTVALSTAEAEINSAVEAAKQALHLKLMLAEMTFSKPMPLWMGMLRRRRQPPAMSKFWPVLCALLLNWIL